MQELIKDFPVITEVNVAWGEMDALQHVNNVVYFRYFESARLSYFSKINLLVDSSQTTIGPVLAETSCKYKLPITYPDTLLIGAKVIDLQEDRFTMEYQIVSKKIGKICTQGQATCVMFDFINNCKVQLPSDIKQEILDLEGS
ncbi:acyl-CoA thioesterase [Vibrio pectenicida]|uniref:Acyl-CoA thioesterase n=1 Tax=Vibrio pectenicida TaxID=62763 RepID=A0A7Y3ZZ18_9VIBR|nr:thioesterase family protein [Vibrio pectenicida]NOH70829.1 acyl-CoA thioesterase [Vibrio pectenicida]